jgi:transposase-like protein
MAKKRRTFSAEFKLDTVLEGVRGEKTIAQICREREITGHDHNPADRSAHQEVT